MRDARLGDAAGGRQVAGVRRGHVPGRPAPPCRTRRRSVPLGRVRAPVGGGRVRQGLRKPMGTEPTGGGREQYHCVINSRRRCRFFPTLTDEGNVVIAQGQAEMEGGQNPGVGTQSPSQPLGMYHMPAVQACLLGGPGKCPAGSLKHSGHDSPVPAAPRTHSPGPVPVRA